MSSLKTNYLMQCLIINEKYSDFESLKTDFIKGDQLIRKLITEYNDSIQEVKKQSQARYIKAKEANELLIKTEENLSEKFLLELCQEQGLTIDRRTYLNKKNKEKYNNYRDTLYKSQKTRKDKLDADRDYEKRIIHDKVLEIMSKPPPLEEFIDYSIMDTD